MTGEKATHQEKELHATSQPVSRETKIYKGQDRKKFGEDRTDFDHCVFTENLRQERVYKKYSATLLGMIQSLSIHNNSVFSDNSSFFSEETH